MRFTPKTEEECQQGGMLARGWYEAVVRSAEEKVSGGGNPMIQLTLDVYGPEGTVTVWDFLLEKMAHKLRHFCFASGLEKKYESGSLSASDCEGQTVEAEIDVQQDKAKKYPPKNGVNDYRKFERGGGSAPKSNSNELTDEDIPF